MCGQSVRGERAGRCGKRQWLGCTLRQRVAWAHPRISLNPASCPLPGSLGAHPFADVVAHHISVLCELLAEECFDRGLVDDDCSGWDRARGR